MISWVIYSEQIGRHIHVEAFFSRVTAVLMTYKSGSGRQLLHPWWRKRLTCLFVKSRKMHKRTNWTTNIWELKKNWGHCTVPFVAEFHDAYFVWRFQWAHNLKLQFWTTEKLLLDNISENVLHKSYSNGRKINVNGHNHQLYTLFASQADYFKSDREISIAADYNGHLHDQKHVISLDKYIIYIYKHRQNCDKIWQGTIETKYVRH